MKSWRSERSGSLIGVAFLWVSAWGSLPEPAAAQNEAKPPASQQADQTTPPASDVKHPVANDAGKPAPLAGEEKPPSLLIEIPDEPKTVDPVTILPAVLAARVTVTFHEQPLRDLVKWLQKERSLNVLVDYPAMADEGILAGEPITDHSDNAPLYLLLNRLKKMGLGWYVEKDTMFITTATQAGQRTFTVPYNLGELLDRGYKAETLRQTVIQAAKGKWEQVDGEGGAITLLGDVLFVRHTFEQHQEIACLLAALRKHGRRTFVCDPAEHELLRQRLNEKKLSVSFDDIPLKSSIQTIATEVEMEIRLDTAALASAGVSERVPVSLKLTDRPLHEVLRALLWNFDLQWSLDDGVLWITTRVAVEARRKVAVFDVRDLCRNRKESSGLMNALTTQSAMKWEILDGEGGVMICPKPGVLVVAQTGEILDDILKLLEDYRFALRTSKVRTSADSDPDEQEQVTYYYRMETVIAVDLEKLLPELVQPETWKSTSRPEAIGTIRRVASRPELRRVSKNEGSPEKADVVLESNSVLIVHQTRKMHAAIRKVLLKIQFGDSGDAVGHAVDGGMAGGMGGTGGGTGGGMGGGGFGGGYFSTPAK